MRGGYVSVLQYIFGLKVKLESHMKYTVRHSNMILLDREMLSTDIFCITNVWQKEVRVKRYDNI